MTHDPSPGSPGSPPGASAPHGSSAPYPYSIPAPYPYSVPAHSGRKFWAFGFLFFIPILGWLIAPIVSLVLYESARNERIAVVRENARLAVNWNLTVSIMMLLGLGALYTSAIAGELSISEGGQGDTWMPVVVVAAALMLIVQLTHLIICAIGAAQADRRVFNPVVMIRFFRSVA